MKFKGNKTPISEKNGPVKGESANVEYKDFYVNKLQVPKDIVEEANSKGIVVRWINAKELQANYGSHKNHWQPYKPEVNQTKKDSIFGADPEGYVRRGDLILGFRSKELHEMHQAALNKKRLQYQQFNKAAAAELRKIVRDNDAGEYVKVSEGYEDDN